MGSLFLFRLRAWSWRHGGLFFVALAALAVRLRWNLVVHRPTDFAFSDMKAYLDRAGAMFDDPGARHPSLALFPFGTHFFVHGIERVFGRENDDAIGAAFAVVGALAVAYTYATAGRFCARSWVRRVVGILLVFYYPWISLGGYVLSEMPFALCVAGAAFHGLRLADRGRRADAWWLGLFLGVGATVRPQILLAAALLAIHVVVRRQAWKSFTRGLVVRAAAPIAILLACSAVRLHDHTGAWGLVSANGPLNTVFGRCHNLMLFSTSSDAGAYFGPPSFAGLRERERMSRAPLFTLDPALDDVLVVQGHMWDAAPMRALADRCVATTGYARQIEYAAKHVALLWVYNVVWPDQGMPRWRAPMRLAGALHARFLLPPAAVVLLLALRRRNARSMLLALHVYALLILAIVYFGDARFRVPYDGIIIVLAIHGYAEIGALLRIAGAGLFGGRAAGALPAGQPG